MSEGTRTIASTVAGQFTTTHWSAVVRAGSMDSPQASEALNELCRVYWYPLYAYARRQGHQRAEAEDLTQAFFARLLEHNFVARAEPEKGRFRTFLLTVFKRFLANEWNHQHAQKRGGFQTRVPIDADLAESRFEAGPAATEQPDKLFERQWAMTLLEQVMSRLQNEYRESGRGELFNCLEACLARDADALPYREIGTQLNLCEAAVKMAMQRLRARYQSILREEIGKTVTSPDEVEAEVRDLFAAFRG
jgi:RNA polymerase sigma-70 factor (ECF subfamily)